MSIERRIEVLEGRHKPARVQPEFHAVLDGACLHPRCQGRTSQEQAALHRKMPTFRVVRVVFDDAPLEGNNGNDD